MTSRLNCSLACRAGLRACGRDAIGAMSFRGWNQELCESRRQLLGIDEDDDAAGEAGLASNEPLAFEG